MCNVFHFIWFKIFSNFPFDFFFNPWISLKYVVLFPNIRDFLNIFLLLISTIILLCSENVPCMVLILSNSLRLILWSRICVFCCQTYLFRSPPKPWTPPSLNFIICCLLQSASNLFFHFTTTSYLCFLKMEKMGNLSEIIFLKHKLLNGQNLVPNILSFPNSLSAQEAIFLLFSFLWQF